MPTEGNLQFKKTVCLLIDVIKDSDEMRSETAQAEAYVVNKAIYACLEVIALHIGVLPEETQAATCRVVCEELPILIESLKKEGFPQAQLEATIQ